MEYYEVAAKWWADQLRSPPKKTTKHLQSFSDEDWEAFFMRRYQEREFNNTTLERIDEFQKILSMLIKQKVEKQKELVIAIDYKVSYVFGEMSISSSYMPRFFLEDALARVGIDWLSIPLRRTMWISPKEISVATGRTNSKTKIFSSETT